MVIQRSEQPEAFRAFEHEGWELNSSGYARRFGPITEQAVAPTLDAAGVAPDRRLLDLCSGPGMLAAAARLRGAEVVGLDFSEAMVALARKRVPDAEFVRGDAQHLPFPDESFDAVVCGFGIIHLPDPAAALAEMHRVLRPRGRAAISVWAPPGPDNGLGLIYGAMRAHGDLNVALPHGPDFFQFSEARRMAEALSAGGFRRTGTRLVTQQWRLETPADFMRGFLEGTVRARALYLAQSATVRRAIESAAVEALQRYALAGDGYAVPMPALVGWGSR